MTDIELFALGALALLGLVFAVEAIYAFFFRNFGLVTFRVAFDVPKADAATVWATYLDERNDWNSVTERLSYEVVSDAPRIVRLSSRMRGTDDQPVTMEMRVDMDEARRSCRGIVISVDGVAVPDREQSSEVFEVAPGEDGVRVEVEARIPVRGWLRVPLHRRNLARIYEDLRFACLVKAGVPCRLERRGWRLWG